MMGIEIRCGSSLHMDIPDNSVQCVVTSPPYWGLRKYDGNQDSGGFVFGLEPAPELYVEHTILFLREIRRVLKDDGVVFWNVGDSYNSGGGYISVNGFGLRDNRPREPNYRETITSGGLKPKDLCLIPFRVALAAQADGWWVRSDIIWAKPNPMPESVKDRPTSSHEYIFVFTKSQKYYWDIDAVREPHKSDPNDNYRPETSRYQWGDIQSDSGNGLLYAKHHPKGRNIRDVWVIHTQPSGFQHYAAFPLEIPMRCIKAATKVGDTVLDPFCGTGRTLEAALELGRKAIGYDISEKYCEMARRRCDRVQLQIEQDRN